MEGIGGRCSRIQKVAPIDIHHENVGLLRRMGVHCDTWLWSAKRDRELNGDQRLQEHGILCCGMFPGPLACTRAWQTVICDTQNVIAVLLPSPTHAVLVRISGI